MYQVSIGSIFKNEMMVLKEWLDHYIHHGIEHFYLINDNSTDDYLSVLEPYKQKITLFHNTIDVGVLNRQSLAYDRYLLPILHKRETQWLCILDLDEYLYSPLDVSIPKILVSYTDYAVLHVNWLVFGSNGYKEQPASIVQAFTKRAPINHMFLTNAKAPISLVLTYGPKYIVNSAYPVEHLYVHTCIAKGKYKNVSTMMSWMNMKIEYNPPLLINHYWVMSEEYWRKVKMVRGDADNYLSTSTRNMNYYSQYDINIETDTRLAEQNASIL